MAEALRLTKIGFAAGSRPGGPPLEFGPGNVMVLVGPNNSGKSQTLREIESWCRGGIQLGPVLEGLEVNLPSAIEDAEAILRLVETDPPPQNASRPGVFYVGQWQFGGQQQSRAIEIHLESLQAYMQRNDGSALRSWLTGSYTVRLDGRTRFLLCQPQQSGDLLNRPENHLWALFQNGQAREEVRRLTAEAFNLHFVVDPTGMQTFRIRMSKRPPDDIPEEQGLDERSRNFHSDATLIQDLSDGVQAYVGLVSAVISLPHTIMLVDEPEAFLHPPLARRLGSSLATIAKDRQASLVVATHSPEFLLGCVEAGDTSIVRLTHDAGVATAHALSATEVTAMTKDALLRSADVLSGVFHRAAVVTEADADRVLYSEINRRLLSNSRGIGDGLFLNANGKNTVWKVVQPLRRIGVPAAAIVDFDIIEDKEWTRLLWSSSVPKGVIQSLEPIRASVSASFQSMGTSGSARPIRSRGIDALSPADAAQATALINTVKQYGVFVVPGGGLESWLKGKGIVGTGTDWLNAAFSCIGQSDDDPNYLPPEPGDVWDFIGDIDSWVSNQGRLGMP